MAKDDGRQKTAVGVWQPDENDVRMVRRCCICPPLASTCLVMVLVMTALWICCEMVGGIVFYNKDGFRFIGVAAYVSFAFALLAGFCYCALVPKFTMRGKRWKALENRLEAGRADGEDAERADAGDAAQAAGAMALGTAGRIAAGSENDATGAAGGAATVTGAAAATAVTARQMGRIGNNAKAMARACGIAVPNTRLAVVAVVAVPVLVLAAAFGVRYVSGAQAIQASQDAAATQVQLVSDAFEAAGLHAGVYEHPSESYSSTGYSVYGYISGSGYYEAGQRVYMHLDESGEMDSVRYEEQIDPGKPGEENLAQAQADFDALGKALEASGVRAKAAGLVAEHAISEEFRRQFLVGDIYTEIRQPSEDVGDCRVSCSFTTDALPDFDESTKPTINLSVTPR